MRLLLLATAITLLQKVCCESIFGCKGCNQGVLEKEKRRESFVYRDANGSIRSFKVVEERRSTPEILKINPEKYIEFHLYTADNPSRPYILSTNNKQTLRKSPFNKKYPTKMIIHGFMSRGKDTIITDIKNSYLKKGRYNVIAVDWSEMAIHPVYHFVVFRLRAVGKRIASFVEFLVKDGGADFGSFHLIGHSLGAHLAGFVGSYLKEGIGRLSRITGLDPAGPSYQGSPPQERLDTDDAEFVDIIHTTSGLGISHSIGHVDFYPNGGSDIQPGCHWLLDNLGISAICSHSRSCEYFAESIVSERGFVADKCSSWSFYTIKWCIPWRRTRMGEPVARWATGNYYLKTRWKPPYASP